MFVHQNTEIKETETRLGAAKVRNGPCEKSIEPVLQQHGIQRQSRYHGGAFVGNHVHKALQAAVIRALTSAPVAVIQDHCPRLTQAAEDIQDRYAQLMERHADCSEKFSVSTGVSDDDLTTLEGKSPLSWPPLVEKSFTGNVAT